MRTIELMCPVCGDRMTVTEDGAAPAGTCPNCGARVQVPLAAFAVLAFRRPQPDGTAESDSTRAEREGEASRTEAADGGPATVAQQASAEAPAGEDQPVPAGPPGEEPATDEVPEVPERAEGLDLFESQRRGPKTLIDEYFQRSPGSSRRARRRLLFGFCVLGALALVALVCYVISLAL